MKIATYCLAAAVGVTAAASLGRASVIDPGLSGAVQTDQWDFAQVIGTYGEFNSTDSWSGPIESNIAGFTAEFDKVSGYGVHGAPTATDAVYVGSNLDGVNLDGGAFSVSQSDVVPGVKTIVFQLKILEAHGYDFVSHVLPVLNYNGGAQTLAADRSGVIQRDNIGTFPNPQTGVDEPLFVNTWMLQWNLSGIAGPISSFDIDWSAVMHARMYEARLDQSDIYSDAPVPEPAMMGLLALGGLVFVRRRNG